MERPGMIYKGRMVYFRWFGTERIYILRQSLLLFSWIDVTFQALETNKQRRTRVVWRKKTS